MKSGNLAIAIILVIFAAVVIWFAATAHADSTCADGRVCWWGKSNYEGEKSSHDCTQSQNGNFYKNYNSAKNRCGNRAVHLIRATGSTEVACLDAGENRPDPGWFNEVDIFFAGSHC